MLTTENFTWQNNWGGGHVPPVTPPPPGSYAHVTECKTRKTA